MITTSFGIVEHAQRGVYGSTCFIGSFYDLQIMPGAIFKKSPSVCFALCGAIKKSQYALGRTPQARKKIMMLWHIISYLFIPVNAMEKMEEGERDTSAAEAAGCCMTL